MNSRNSPSLSGGQRQPVATAIGFALVFCLLILPTCKKAPAETGPACQACEATQCTAMFSGDDKAWGCQNLPESDRSLCEAFVDCVRSTHCARPLRDVQACYCGTAHGHVACLTGAGNGACKAQAEAAAKTTIPGEVAARFTDLAFPIGPAVNQIACDIAQCASECPM